jgi:hypothetical protein
VGACGLERGLVALDGALARRWWAWLIAALIGFGMWAMPTGQALDYGDNAPLVLQLSAALGFSVACATGCLFLVAIFVRFSSGHRSWALDSLSSNAYGMYLVHYLFVVWLQYVLLHAPLIAVAKAAVVFGGTLIASWALTVWLGRVPLGSLVLGAKR